jgi:hypothetical protein
MFNVAMLAPILQALMTTRADELANLAGFIQRRRGLTGADFLQALTLGYLKRRRAPLEDLAQPLGISRQALHQRFDGPAAPAFFKAALLGAINHVLAAQPALCPLLAPFHGVYLDDCTQSWLPDEAEPDFPVNGKGTDHAKARMKLLARWEIQQGQARHLGIHPGSTSDSEAEALAPPLPKGALHLADLGFADFGRLADEHDRGIYWVTRLPAQTRPYPEEGKGRPLAEQLAAWREQGLKVVDVDGAVGAEDRVKGRLVCLACPQDVAARRLLNLEKDARKRKRPVSAPQREMCRWTVLFTNVPRGRLNALQLWQVYRRRWRIELLFRRFKSEGGLSETASGKRYRVESEWYLKLLGQVIRNWMQSLRGGPLADVNQTQLGRVIADQMQKLLEALKAGRDLKRVLAKLAAELRKVRERTARKKRKTDAQTFAQSLDHFVLLS